MKKGVGLYQLRMGETSERIILQLLVDGEWHRYQELLQKTGLSTATLSKHLKRLEGCRLIERRMNGRTYPPPVFYRLNPIIAHYARGLKDEEIEGFLSEVLEFSQVTPYYAILIGLAFERGLTADRIFEGLAKFNLFKSKEEFQEVLNRLEKAHLITRSAKGWELTFPSLVVIAGRFAPYDELDKIAKAYNDTWLIFQEWEDLTGDKEIKEKICLSLRMAADLFEKLGLSLTLPKRFMRLLDMGAENPELLKFLFFSPQAIKEATLRVLYLENVFRFGLKIETSPPNVDIWLVKLWKICVRNQNLRRFLEICFEEEEQKIENLRKFKKWLLEDILE
ncbi:MAG: ArsR family transcriptional regulator [Candidatus Bathyarchaeia archaeon]